MTPQETGVTGRAKDRGADTTPSISVETLIPSDALPTLAALLRQNAVFAPLLSQLFRALIVIDANAVNAEIRWRLKRREKPNARTALQEIIECGVFIAVAPNWLKVEIEEHVLEIAADCGVEPEKVQQEWQSVAALIRFYQPIGTARNGEAPDIDDIPYAQVLEELGAAAILSNDKHLRQMNLPVISLYMGREIQSYSRAITIRLATYVSGIATVNIGLEAFQAGLEGLKRLWSAFRRLPVAVQFAIGGALLIVLAHPKTRDFAKDVWKSVVGSIDPKLWLLVADLGRQIGSAYDTSNHLYEKLLPKLTTGAKTRLIVHARRTCISAGQPLPIAEIERRILAEGYKSMARNFRAYLRRVMIASGQFVESPRGFWAIRSVVQQD